jgi:phage host-nuclease inhibitor protein Gam
MTTRNFNPEERSKLKNLIKEAIGVQMEVETLNGGLNDTVKAIADEMQIKPGVLKRAIKSAYKRDFDQARDDIDLIESILNATDNLGPNEE